MGSVFLLWYIHARDTENEDELLIGVYSTENEAEAAIGRLKGKPGFVDAPDGFQIVCYELNQDQWTEGYIIAE